MADWWDDDAPKRRPEKPSREVVFDERKSARGNATYQLRQRERERLRDSEQGERTFRRELERMEQIAESAEAVRDAYKREYSLLLDECKTLENEKRRLEKENAKLKRRTAELERDSASSSH